MKKLLNTLFVTSEDKYLALENENVVVWNGEERAAQYPLVMLEGIVSFSYKGASPALMGACAERNIQLTFLTPRGRFLARCCGMENGNVLLRRTQYRTADRDEDACRIARNLIFGKVYNTRWIVERALRDHVLRVDEKALREVSQRMAAQLPAIETLNDPTLHLYLVDSRLNVLLALRSVQMDEKFFETLRRHTDSQLNSPLNPSEHMQRIGKIYMSMSPADMREKASAVLDVPMDITIPKRH